MLVIDPCFGDQLRNLAMNVPLWIVESPINKAALDCPETGPARLRYVTTFPVTKVEAPQESILRIAGSLDQHHNELAQDPPYDALDIYGVAANVDLLDGLRLLGFDRMSQLDGFVRVTKMK